MKELTIKKETLDVVRQMVADGQVSQEVAEKYFPELRESESEKIRKALKEYFINSFQNNGVAAICGVHIIDILTWLEKQGKQKPIVEMKSPEESLGISSKEYNKIVNDCLYGESKFANKVEPKFAVGDWVVQENIDYWENPIFDNYFNNNGK